MAVDRMYVRVPVGAMLRRVAAIDEAGKLYGKKEDERDAELGVNTPTAQERSHVGVVTPSQLAWVDARLEDRPSDTERAFRRVFGAARIGHDALIQLIYRRRAALGVKTTPKFTPSQLAWVDARLEDRPSDTERAFRRVFGAARIGHDALIQLIYRRRAALGVKTTPKSTDEGHLDRIPVAALKPLPRTPADDARDAMFAACRRRMAKERERLASLRRERLRKSETWRIA